MKIAYVITKSNWGGAQRYVFDLATSVHQRGHEVVVACGGRGLLAEKLAAAGIRVVTLEKLGRDVSILNDISVLFSLYTFFKQEKPDVVHLNSSKIGGLGGLAGRMAGISKIFFTVHGFAFNEDRPGWQKMLIKLVSWLTLVLTTDTICIAKRELNQAKNWPLAKNKLHLIYNGIGYQSLLDRQAGRQQLNLNDKSLVIGTIAELTKNKGLDILIAAFKKIPNASLIIIGGGELKDVLAKQIANSNLSDRVVLAGFVKDAAHLLPAFDIFVLPSRKEGLPYVILEAGLAKLPVVASAVGGIPEIIDSPAVGIAVPAGNKEALATALTAFQNAELRKSVGNNLYKKVTTDFSLDAMVDATLKLYA